MYIWMVSMHCVQWLVHMCFIDTLFILQLGKTNRHQYSFHQFNIIRTTERKLIFVPIAFIVIRLWGLIDNIMNFCVQESVSQSYQQMGLSIFILIMAVSLYSNFLLILFSINTSNTHFTTPHICIKFSCTCSKWNLHIIYSCIVSLSSIVSECLYTMCLYTVFSEYFTSENFLCVKILVLEISYKLAMSEI